MYIYAQNVNIFNNYCINIHSRRTCQAKNTLQYNTGIICAKSVYIVKYFYLTECMCAH